MKSQALQCTVSFGCFCVYLHMCVIEIKTEGKANKKLTMPTMLYYHLIIKNMIFIFYKFQIISGLNEIIPAKHLAQCCKRFSNLGKVIF